MIGITRKQFESREGEAFPGSKAIPETILYVEDDAFVREVTAEILRSAGYDVLSATNADEAENIFLAHCTEIALLFTDIVLPGKSGPELVTTLRRNYPRLMVLFATGYPEQWSVPGLQERCLAKPFSAETLLNNVSSLLDRGLPRCGSDSPLRPPYDIGRPAGFAREFQTVAPLG